MAKVKATGTITIRNITNIGKLSSYITSSQPLMVVYDPNSATQYEPNWANSNLVLTPVVFFNDTQLSLSASGLTITWQRQVGAGEVTALTTGETVKGNILTVSKNILADTSMITYICSISYIDPNTNRVAIKSRSQMSFSLVKNAPELSDCNITGDTVFKYNTSGTLTSASSIKLTANLTNTTLKQWQYKKSDGTFAAYPNAGTSVTLTVNASDAVFVNDVAVIKLVTADNDVFDLHNIVKLRDGAAGSSTITCNLSNDTQSVPCNSNGALYSTSLNGCDTTISILKGSANDTGNWTVTATPSSGITGTYDAKTYKYTVTGISVESGYVEFTCTRSGYTTITKRFTINKDRSGSNGADAVFYSVGSDVTFMKLNKSKVFTPSAITFSGQKIVGNNAGTVYSGRFKIYESTDGATYTLKYTSGSDESSKKYTPSANTVKTIKCELYQAGNTTKLLDSQTVSVVIDGTDGQTGAAGKDAINVVLGNSAEVIACDTSGKAKEAKDITIPFDCYQGTKRIAGTASLGTLPSGVTLKSNTAATASATGNIVLTVAKGATIASTQSGDITITFTASGLTSVQKFTWTKNVQAYNGTNAVLFQLMAPQGDVILKNLDGNVNTVLLKTQLLSGTTVVTSGISYVWKKYTNGAYTTLPGQTASTLTVTADMVESLASFECTATYGGKPYVAYWTVTDKQDEISVDVICSVGDTFVNNTGVGAIYAKLMQKNKEYDELKTTTFSTSAPSNPTSGDFYYKLDTAAKTVSLMKYDGSAWNAATESDLPKGTYNWYRRDRTGKALDTETPYKTGKVIFAEGKMIDDILMNFDCDVEIDI